MSNRFEGSYRKVATRPVIRVDGARQPIHGPRGIGRMNREMKRQEAEARNSRTPHNRTKRHRLGKCSNAEHLIREVFHS